METLNIGSDLNVNFNGFGFNNFNPEEIQSDETINAVFVVDTSGSVRGYVNELNAAYNEFVNEFKDSHVKERLLVSVIEFNDSVNVVSGFQPIYKLAEQGEMDFSQRLGGLTALYDGVDSGLANAVDYREQLENSGVGVKTILYIITDGRENASQIASADTIKQKIDDLLTEERNFASFSSVLFAVCNKNDWDDPSGQQLKGYFEGVKNDMGIQYLAPVGTTGKEIRAMIKFISSSISSVSSGGVVSAPAF